MDNNNITYRVVTNQGKEKEYSESEYLKNNVAGYLEKYLPGQYTVHKLEKVNNAVPQAILDDGDYLMSVPNLDGTMSSKVYKGKELKDRNLIDDYFDKNFLGKYTMQRVRSYDNADIAYRGDALGAKAYMDRNAIDDFDARNNAFMEEYKQKKAAYDLAAGSAGSWKDPNFLKTADYVVTSKEEYDKLKKERRRLQREYEDNPLVKGAYQNLAQSAQASADLNLEKENSSSGQDYNNYKHARKFDLDAAQLYALPVFTGDDSIDKDFWNGMGAGVADVFEDRDFWTLGITELARNVGVSKIFEGLKEKGLDISEMSEQDFDYYLTDSQKSLLFSFMRYGEAAAQRSGNMPKGYSVGQTSAGTLGYMTQFLFTGGVGSAIAKGVGKAATKAVAKGTANGLTKFLSRAYGKGVKGAIEQSVKRGMVSTLTADGNYLTSAMKPVINATAKTAGTVYEYGVKPIARSVARTPFMMSTYVAASEDLLERAQSTEELGSIGSAFLESVWNALPDQLIENWSEDMGPAIETFGGAAKKGIMKAAGATVGKINVGKIPLGQWGKWVADSYANKVLLQAGFNGLVGEMTEEWIGNAARVAVGLMDKEEFDEFASPKQQIEMAISFAPMSLLGLGSSSVAAAKQSKEYKSSVAEMRGVLNRAGMTEGEISDILDTKHSKQEIADALTPVLSKILSNATTENGQTTSVDDYKATLRFARNIAANEVMSAAEDAYKQELRTRVREQLSEELGAVSMDDPRGKFSYDIPMEGGNSLEAVTTVEDENGHTYYYMGEKSSQVLLKPSNGGDVLFVDKKTYDDKASSGEYKVHTQSADSFLDAYASVEQEKAETAARDKHLNDSRKQIIDTYKTNPSINLGTNETPKVGIVTGFLSDGLVVEFENPIEINGVIKKIHKVSYEQAGNAIGVDSTYRTEAEVAQDEADSIMRKQKEVSVYNGQFKGMEFTNDGKLYKFLRMVDAPYQDENGVDVVKVAAQDGTEVVEVTMPLADLKDRLDKQKTAQLQAEQTKAGVDASKEDDGTPKDFRGNPLPMKTNDSGEQEVDTDALWNKDPEAFLRWNDERRGGTTEDSQELLSANIAKLQAQRQALVDKKSVETVPSEREAIDGKILALDNTINLYSAILQKYQAESNYKQKTQVYAAAFADLQRRMLNAKKQEQYDELKRAEAELMRKYLDETADSAQNIQLAKTCADLQLELNKFADMPVSMVTYANVESVMREDGASDEAIQSVLQKMAVVNRENLVNGHSYVLKGCHNNGMIYIFAEGNANIDSARTTYYHERQHELNARGDSAAVNEVMDLAKGDAEALYKTLEAIVGESVASNYKGSSAGVLADEIVAFTIQEAYSNENYTQALRDLGLSNELITIITKEYGRQTGKENSVSERSEDGHRDERRGGRKSANQNEPADEGESSNEQLGGVRQGDTSEHGEEVIGRSLTSDEADALLAQMENSAEVAPEIELTPDNWLSQFGEDGLVDTPIGKVKMGENQYFKIILKKREKEFGMIYPTLSNPDIVIEEPSTSDTAERNTSLLFVKTFIVNGEKVKYYASVTVSKDSKEVVISNHFIEKAAFKKKLLADSTLYLKPSLSNSSDRHLAEHQDDVPDLLPTQDSNGSNSSSSEGTKSEPKKQDNNELSSFASEILNDTLAQLPEELKGRVTVNESSTGDESYENFIQSYNIDGKPSGITRIELFDAKINENPTSFVIDGSDVDASREEQDRWESLADEYMKEHPEVNLIKYDEVGIGFKSFMDAYNFLKWAEQRRESPIQGLENYSRGQIKEMVREHVARVLADAGFDVEVLDIEIHGSMARGDAKNESDLDVVVEYKGAEKEDGLFNVLNDEDDALFIDDIKVDINPIRAEESGTMSDYMKRSEAYDKEKLNASTAQSTYQKKEWSSDSDVNEMKARQKYLEDALRIGTEESKEVFPEYDAYKAERNELKKRAPGMQPDDVQKALAAIEDKYKEYNKRIRAIYDELSNLNDSIAFSDQKEREKETSEKKAQQAEAKRTKYNGFLEKKTALAASSADKALSKKSIFDSDEMTLAEFVESHFADGSLKFEKKKEQSYPPRARWNRMDQKEQSEWMEKHKPETVYVVNGYVVNKTAYDYAEFLSKTKSDSQKQSKEDFVEYTKAPKANKPDPFQFVWSDKKDTKHRPLEGVYHSDGMIIASDARILLAVKSEYPSELEGKITDKQGQVIEHKYANWKSPFDRKEVLPVDVNLEKLALFLEQIKSQVPTERQAKADTWKSRTVFIDFGNGTIVGFEYYLLVKFVNAARFLNSKLSLTNKMLFGEAEDGKLILAGRSDTRKAATFDAQKGEGKLLVDKKGDPLDNEEITSEPAQETPAPEQSSKTRQEPKERIEDVGEKIAGARKDMLREYAASMGNVNIESLISLPFSKVFKRPNLNKAVENGALRSRDARFAEAVMSAFLSNAKPRINTSSTSYKRNKQEKKIKEWAEKAYVGIQLLSELFNADEAERDAIIERVLSEKAYKEQEIEERKAELKSWNNGREFNGQCYPVNPVAVFMKVYEQLDYNMYGEQKCPIAEIEPDSFFEYYRLSDANGKSKYYPKRKLNSVDAVIDEIVYATKLENADSDTDHPMSTLFFKGEGRTVVNGKVEYEKYNAFFSAYGKQVEIGQSFSSKEEGVSWVEEHHDEYNDIVNKQLAEEKAAKNERSQSQDVLVERYWDVGAKKSRYAITLSDKYVPKSRDVFNTMPYSIADGFETKEAAEKYLESHKAEIDSIIADIAQTRRSFTYFDGDAKSRVGEDYRKGKDVSAEEFRSTFGFRGVQFGEWANQADRQAALNNAYDSFLDLAKFLAISPLAISLNGELGMAFGSRGRGGKAAAHYELEEVVINLTKPSGAGSLAHEWWHALDNYFARQSNVPLGMVTETKTIPMRDEMRKAYNQLIDNVEKSNYNKRSRQRGAGYWGSMVEETARLFETWVFDELHKRGENNHFLTSQDPSYEETFARNSYRSYINMLNLKNEHRAEDSKEKVLTFEEFKETPMALMGYVYPTQKELTEFDHDLRNIFGTVRERTDEGTGKVALFSIGKKESSPSDALSNNTEAKQLAFDAAMTMLDNAGVPVESLSDKAMRQMAEMANALETVSSQNENLQTVVSSASGAKIIKNLDNLTSNLEKEPTTKEKTFLGTLAKALNSTMHGSRSQYATFEAKNGKVVTIRLASHNAKTSTFDNHGEDTGISIVISARENNGVNNDGKAHVTEFYYDAIKLRKAEGKPLVEIVKSIKQTLFSGEYKDTTGLAQIEEVNADALPEFMTVYHGSGAKFDRFDHSHMGEGEGSQSYGWGTYVTEVEGIGRTYAEASLGKGNSIFNRFLGNIKDNMSKGVPFEDAKKQLIERLEGIFEKQTDENLYGDFRKSFKQLKALSESDLPKRVLYTVDIPDDISSQPSAIDSAIREKAIEKRNENQGGFGIYLHWERKVSAEQYPMWIKAMQFLGVEGNFASVEEFKSYNNNMSSIDIGFEIRTLSKMLGPQKVSEALHKAGFTGISYPAEYMTGGRSDGARNYVIFDENDLKITNRIEFLRDGDIVYGAVVGGRILLNKEHLNPNTPIHEYTHLWDKACQENNPELWLRGIELMRATPLWDELRDDPNYSALDDRALASEVHARLSGENGAAILEKMSQKVLDDKQSPVMAKAKKLAVIEELKDWLGDFWAWLKDTMTGWTREEASEVSLEDFIKMPISDLAKGVNLSYAKELSLFDDIDLQDNLDGPVRFSVAEDEANSIVEKAKADGTFMKAPNGKPSNLNERQWAQVRTTSFKNWFGDWEKEPSSSSKVIDENGEPLVVYHGGPYRFYEFDKSKMGRTTQAESAKRGFFFTDSRSLADLFAEGAADGSINEAELIDYIKRELSIKPDEDIKRFFDAFKESDLAYEEFLEENDGFSDYDFLRGYVYEYIPTDVEKASERELMVNYILDSIEKEIWSGWFDKGSAISKKLSGMDIEWGHTEPVFLNLRNPIVDDIKRDYYNEGESINPMAPVMDSARRLNRDGVIFTGIYEEGRHQKEIQYVVFEPNQIKTAVDNNGEFSADNDDIRYSIGVTQKMDAVFQDAFEQNNVELARELLDRAAKNAGYKYKGFHGSNAVFNTFDPAKLGSRNWLAPSASMGFFASSSRKTAEAYTGLNSMDSASLFLNNDAQDNMARIKEQFHYADAEALEEQNREEFERQYRAEHGYKENVEDNAERMMEIMMPLYEKHNLTNKQLDEIKEGIFRNFDIEWNKTVPDGETDNNLNLMIRAYEETQEHKSFVKFQKEVYDAWEKTELKRLGYTPNIKELYIKIENPLIHDFKGEGRDVESFAARMDKAKKDGRDGCIFKNVEDGADTDTIYAVFDNTQFKSAEPFTFDDDGKLIPLSERFSEDNADVRFSIGDSREGRDELRTNLADEAANEESGVRYSIVDDPATLRRLDAEPKMKVYRAMQLVDGKLYPPMSGKVNGEWREGLSVEDLGKVWEQADENPELVDENGRFTLNKGNGKSLKARYNPYIHTSVTPLNDQFSSAQDRPELVTVEVEVPVSELYSQYKAEKAKDKVGAVEWKAGVVQAKLSGKRTVVLSRWDRPMRIVPNSEVADEIVKMFNGRKITMPSNVVTPELRAELEKRGVPFVETDNKGNRIKDSVEFSIGEGLSEVNEKFNEDLSRLTEANADSITLSLGRPSQILLAAGVIDKPMKLYGNKVIKKMKKHGFELEELRDLPRAVAEPIAVFNNYGEDGNRAILTELKTADRHILVSLVVGKDGVDADFNIVSSVFGKGQDNIVDWITKGYLTYINKEKALQYLHFSESSIPEASNPERLSTATKVVKDFVNPTLRPEDSVEFSIESLDNKNELLFGQLERAKEFGVLMGIYDALPDDVRGEINKRAPSFGYNFASATADYFAKLSIKEGSFSKEEWALIRGVRDLMKSHLGIRELSLYDALWALCRMAYKDQLDILSSAYKALAAHKLGFSTSELAQEKATTDAVNFSISEDMKSSSAAEMYAKATSYFKNRLKEGAVDMFTSINDLVEAIELATGDKADAFEDIRLALNQQSSKGLAEMENYTRAYLQPMFDTIGRIVNNTGLSYEDLSRYVVLKHAVERNVVFAKRDAKAFYKNILNSTVNTLEKDNSDLNKKRKAAVMDGDRETLAAIDKQIDDNNVLIAKAKADYEAALKRIESGNDIKYNEFREQDYGGLTSMYSEYPGLQPRSAYKTDEAYNQAARKVRKPMFDNVADMEEAAIKEVADFENKITIPVADELWDRINAATKATLDGQYQSNMLSKEQYEAVRGQFKYYVPLRGFKDITAEDIWSYYNSSRSDSFAPAIISAKGRTTEAENPFNWIGTMASSSIAAGVKNRTKLALYYFIANRPNQDLVSLGETWYRYDAQATSDYQSTHPGSTKRIFSAVYPPVTEGLDLKAAKDAYAAWENDLKAAKEKGEAYQKKGKLNVNDDVAFIDAKQTPEHIIRCRVLGSEVDMIINSNPRAAQAVNGLLNLETDKDYKVVFGKILRYLSAINTSLNPEFWISNMQRDLLFGVMSSFINGNDVKSFGKNILSPRRLMKLMRNYRNGTLGNSKLESYYREFAENGAITGYTVINSNDYWEQKIQATIDPKFSDKVKASKFLAAWQNLGEATEQMTRFAAYVTARENGQDVVTAVSAAKEITVNFNRKGSGKAISRSELRQLLKKNGEHLNEKEIVLWHVVSFIPAYGRRMIMFFNAGVQALNAMYKLYAKDSRRFASCMLGYFLLGVAGALAHGLLGGDDDDNDYLDMPDYTRQNNLLLGCNGIYLKWALPQEARVFYAFGDMFVNHLMGRSPHKNLLKEMSGAINDMLPLPLLPFGVEFSDFVRDFVPSAVQPIADIASNKDFTGSRVYNDLKYLSDEERKRTPRYQYALSGTGSGFVDASKFLNILSGGNEYDAGWVNVPPEVMQHIVETLGGGLLTTVNRGIRTLSGTVDAVTGKDVFNQDLSVRNAPFLNRVLIVNDERTRNAYVTGLFNYYKSEALHAKSVANRIGKKEGLSAKRKYMHSSDYEVYKVYDKYQSELKRYDSQIREETDAAERKSLMRRQDEVRRKMVKEMTTKNR